jgi:hypothetical protein
MRPYQDRPYDGAIGRILYLILKLLYQHQRNHDRSYAAQSPDHPHKGNAAGPATRHAASTHIWLTARRYQCGCRYMRSPSAARRAPHCARHSTTARSPWVPDKATLRAELPDQPAVVGLLRRIAGLGLELIEMQRVAPPLGNNRWFQEGLTAAIAHRVDHLSCPPCAPADSKRRSRTVSNGQ